MLSQGVLPATSDESAMQDRIDALEKIYSTLLAKKEALGEATAGLKDEVFKTRFGLFGSITLQESRRLLPDLCLPEDGNINILDLGSGGSARFIFHLAAVRSNIRKLIGIEVEEDLHAISLEVLHEAQKSCAQLGGPLVRPMQVELLNGNFFDKKFKHVIRASDRVFYYLSTTDDEEKVVDLIGKNLVRPNARFLAFGDAENPFPELVTKYKFTRTDGELLIMYSKNTR